MNHRSIQVLPDPAALAHEAAGRVVAAGEEAILLQDTFSLVLAGQSFRQRLDWSKVQIYFGDERCVPPDDPQSNYRMAREALIDPLGIPPANVHRMRGEIDPQQAAREYGQMLKEHFGDIGPDLALLGMGDDGHTASLFPHTAALDETHHRCVANYVEKLGAWRLTLTAPFINRSRDVLILISGSAKAAAVKQVLEGPADPKRLPIQLIQPQSHKLIWLLDAPAAGME